MDSLSKSFLSLVRIMDELREGCPWDRKQTIHSLRSLTIEETYELTDAILQGDTAGIKEELGDLLLHILFYARIAREEKWFNLEDVMAALSKKLVDRHPHIYGDLKLEDAEQVKQNWEKLKQKEGKKGLLSGVPNTMPAMVKALRMQDKAKQVGFEWEHIDQVWEKVEEELGELREAIDNKMPDADVEEELGDVFFALINYSRFLKIDPETALDRVNRKFRDRFHYIESHADRPLQDLSLQEMELLWKEAKKSI